MTGLPAVRTRSGVAPAFALTISLSASLLLIACALAGAPATDGPLTREVVVFKDGSHKFVVGRTIQLAPVTPGGQPRKYVSVYDRDTRAFWYSVLDGADATEPAATFSSWTFIEGDEQLIALSVTEGKLYWAASARHYPSLEAADKDVLAKLPPPPVDVRALATDPSLFKLLGPLVFPIDLPSALGDSVARPDCIGCPWYFSVFSANFDGALWHLLIADGAGKRHSLALTRDFTVAAQNDGRRHEE